MASEQRFVRLAEARDAVEIDSALLLERLEAQAEETGRLAGRVDALESALRTERDTRRRAVETLKRERKAAEALAERAEAEAAAHAEAAAEVERLRQMVAANEHQLQMMWARVAEAERPLWRKLLRRPAAT
jgi:hypothetical protein